MKKREVYPLKLKWSLISVYAFLCCCSLNLKDEKWWKLEIEMMKNGRSFGEEKEIDMEIETEEDKEV